MRVATTVTKTELPQISQECEPLQWLDVVLRGQCHLAHRLSFVDCDAELLQGVFWIHHLCDKADAANLRELPHGAVRHRHAKEWKRLWLARHHYLLLREWQQ